jgi:acetyl-CoA carboxylase carboxyl transferase subunit beta
LQVKEFIEQTIKASLPEGFQRAEFLLEHGLIDAIVPRDEHKKYLSDMIRFFMKNDNYYSSINEAI